MARNRRPEIGECDPDAAFPQAGHGGSGTAGVAHQRGLRYLQFQPLRRKPGAGKRRANQRGQVILVELHGGQVDGDEQRPSPGGRVHARLIQGPARQRHDEAALFEDRDECFRRDRAALPMMPAHQRFHAHDFAVALGQQLIVQRNKIVAQG